MISTFRTVAAYFDNRVIDTKTKPGRFGYYRSITTFQLRDLLAATAYQKLGDTMVTRTGTGNKRVPGFDTMGETFIEQKFEGAVDNRRCNHRLAFGRVEAGQYFVSALRRMRS
jgi:hypothetical protein